MPSDNTFSSLDTNLEVAPEKISAGVLPEKLGQTAIHVLSGTLNEIRDPNNLTKTLYSKITTYRKMQADPTVGGALQGYENILSLVSWKTEPVDREESGIDPDDFDEDKAMEYRDFVQSCFTDTGSSIEDLIASALDMLAIGFQLTVPQFKIRAGYNDDPRFNSKYSDGRIGWKSWKTIRQESVDKWLVPDGEGYDELTGVRQRLINGGYETIPRNRLLLFRTTTKGGNMEGESILYSAVSTWIKLQKTLDIEQVSLSRNLEGIPVLKLPNSLLSENATEDEVKLRDYLIRMAKSVKYNEQTALVLPKILDEHGNELLTFELMTAGANTRVDQCRMVAQDQEKLIAESILANFLKLGSGGGSYAMSSSLQDMFVLAMKKYLDNISSVINNEAIPMLLRANGMDHEYAPKLVHEGLDIESIAAYVDALVKLVQSGVVAPTKQLQRHALNKLAAPTEGADQAWEEILEMQEVLLNSQTEQNNQNTTESEPTQEQDEELEKSKNKTSVEIFHKDGKCYSYDRENLVLTEIPM